MLNFVDYRMVSEKVVEALRRKHRAVSPCSVEAWREALKEFGISADDTGYRSGFLRVTDPVGAYIFNTNGDLVAKGHGVLNIPEDVVEKILVLGDLP